MKQIPQKIWSDYVKKLSLIDKTAAAKVKAYLTKNGIPTTYEASQELIEYANGLVMKYGEASAALSCEMYDAISLAEGAAVPSAVPAALPEYGEVAKSINGTVKIGNIEIIAGAVERLVKMPGADTMLQNAKRDGAEWAWIPSGDTCAFCITLASRGWQPASNAILKGGHAEHIHANCDCNFMIRHDSSTNVRGYDPDKYREMYDNAEGKSSKDKINSLRREFYAKNKGIVGDESSKAEELISGVFKFNKIDFTPAKNIAEAEAYANNFISGGFNLTGKNISYKGFDVDVANQINHRLGEIYNDFNIPKLSSLESYGKANKRAWNGNSEAPMFTTNFGNIGLNNTLIKSQKLIDKYNEQGKKSFQYVLDNIDVLKGESRKQAEAYKIAGRSLVGNSVEDFITHEVGHHISYIPEVNKTLSQIQSDTNWKDFAQNLSGYSTHSFGEYFAESFNAFCKGEQDKLQPELIEIFEGIRRK